VRSRPLRPSRPSNATHNKSTSEAASIEYQTPQSRPFALASVRFCSQAVALRGLAYVRGGRPLPLFSHSAARSAPSPGVCPDGCTHGHARRDPDPRSEPRARPSPCRGAARRRVADACRGAASVVGRRSGGWAARRVLHTTNLSTLKHQHINTVPLVSVRWVFKIVFPLPRLPPSRAPTDLLHVDAQHAAWCGERVDAGGGELKTLALLLHDGRTERRLRSAATGLTRVDTCAPG
jgi:hypothetical protein